MRLLLLLCLTSIVTRAFAEEKPKCRLANLIPTGTLEIEIPDSEEILGEKAAPPKIDDPLVVKNVSITLDRDVIKGTYSLSNGVVIGLSTLVHDFDYDYMRKRIAVNATVEHVRLTGDYAIIGGEVNITSAPEIPINDTDEVLGVHTIYGIGPLNVSAADVVASAGLRIKIDRETQYVSIEDLQLDLVFSSAYVVAENLVIDDKPVDWEDVNGKLKPTYDAVWGAHKGLIIQYIQQKINWLLEGCTLMDLISIIKPKDF